MATSKVSLLTLLLLLLLLLLHTSTDSAVIDEDNIQMSEGGVDRNILKVNPTSRKILQCGDDTPCQAPLIGQPPIVYCQWIYTAQGPIYVCNK